MCNDASLIERWTKKNVTTASVSFVRFECWQLRFPKTKSVLSRRSVVKDESGTWALDDKRFGMCIGAFIEAIFSKTDDLMSTQCTMFTPHQPHPSNKTSNIFKNMDSFLDPALCKTRVPSFPCHLLCKERFLKSVAAASISHHVIGGRLGDPRLPLSSKCYAGEAAGCSGPFPKESSDAFIVGDKLEGLPWSSSRC